MAPRTGPSLKEMMRNRNKAPSPQEKNKSKQPANPLPPPPQVPADLGLKPNPDLRRKRPVESDEEGELGPSKGTKQARQAQEHRSRRSHSVDSREEPQWPKYIGHHEFGHPYWRLTMRPSRWMPYLGTFAEVMQAGLLRLCNSPSSYPKIWRPTGVSIILTSSFP